MSSAQDGHGSKSSKPPKEVQRLILCFDGTGNTFSGSNADTNVVKLLSMLDRTYPKQYHYYQAGIGTYDVNETSVNKSWLGEMRSSISQTIDQGFATTFDAHVMAGYRFLMRYYTSGAKIYIFGFSRGAYTAKFLARMIHTVGLLCKGNEEMVPFAFLLYQRYLSGQLKDRTVEQKEQLKNATTLEQLMKAVPVDQLKEAMTVKQLKEAIPDDQLKAATTADQLMSAISVDQLKEAMTVDQLKAAMPADQLKAATTMTVDQLKASISIDQLKASIPVDQLIAANPADQPTSTGLGKKLNKVLLPLKHLKAAMTAEDPVELIDVRTLEEVREERLQDESQPLLNGDNSTTSGGPNEAFDELKAFSHTFCREEKGKDGKGENIKVFFLGIWDCVSSVAVLERKAPIPIEVVGTAHYVRHAVAVDERRVKFKAALLAQDIRDTKNDDSEDIKEVWFPGCHGDVGGGWPAGGGGGGDKAAETTENKMLWQRSASWKHQIKRLWKSWKPKGPSPDVGADDLQMSDIPLAWMIHELELVDQQNPLTAVKWNPNVKRFKERFEAWFNEEKRFAIGGFVHDSLSFGRGTSFFKVLLWRFMEYLPIICRWELRWTEIKPLWENVRFPLNKGRPRDMPHDAVLHESLIRRLREDPLYRPDNCNGRGTLCCLQRNDTLVQFTSTDDRAADGKHQTYKFVHVARINERRRKAVRSWVQWARDVFTWKLQLTTACAIAVIGFCLVRLH
ncbi:hypothetical protein ACQRIT_005286 [Beauveria bassiana]